MSASAMLVCDMITAYGFQAAETVAAHATGAGATHRRAGGARFRR
jgi:hypothetical protein